MTAKKLLRPLATGKPYVHIQQPDWTLELLIALVVVMGIGLLTTIGEFAMAREEALRARASSKFWRELAQAPERAPTVRVEPNGVGFKCTQFNVRREWERAVSMKCQELGGLLVQARASQ